MFRKIAGILFLSACVPVVAVAAEREPEVLQRAGKWEVNYDTDSCRLFGQFGDGDKAVVAQFTRFEPGDHFDLALYGKRLPEFDMDARVPAKLRFEPNGEIIQKEGLVGHAGKLPLLMFTSLRLDGWRGNPRNPEPETGPAVTPEQEAAVSGVSIEIATRRPFRLALGSLGKPMELMRACQADLVRHWGYDPQVQSRLLRGAKPVNRPANWLRSEDYPVGAISAGNNGVVQFRLDVDAEGKVAKCTTLFRTKPDVFGDVTCAAIARRARFEPALDAEGKPVRSFFVNKVRWQAGS